MDGKLSKVKRQTWSSSAVDLFFEGLYQHGKDFPKILEYIQTKQRKLNHSIVSGLTYNQVRFFYYRTWHKVELLLTDPSSCAVHVTNSEKKSGKHLNTINEEVGQHAECGAEGPSEDEVQLDSSLDEADDTTKCLSPKRTFEEISEDVSAAPSTEDKARFEADLMHSVDIGSSDKNERRKDVLTINGIQQSLDLIALICYWRLKKKYPAGDRSFARKLSELVYYGATAIPGRMKGKRRTQLKIPVCGALRHNSTGHADKVMLSSDLAEPLKCTAATGDMDESDNEPSNIQVVPLNLTVELTPLSLSTWLLVQREALNPRIRVRISSSKKIEDLEQCLVKRFSVEVLRFYIGKSSDYSKEVFDQEEEEEEEAGCVNEEDVAGVGDKAPSNHSDRQCVPSSCVLSELYTKNGYSGALRLSYEIVNQPVADQHDKFRNLFKLVKFIKPSMQQDFHKPTVNATSKVYTSPKVAQYLRSLPPLAARKSPSKYKRIRTQTAKKDTKVDNEQCCVVQVNEMVPSLYSWKSHRKLKRRESLSSEVGGNVRQLVPKPLTFFPDKRSIVSPARKILNFTQFEVKPKPVETEVLPPVLGEGDCTSGNIQEAVLNQYLLSSHVECRKDDGLPQFSLSDTVNELLKGFKEEVLIKEKAEVLSMETEDVLPTFSNVLKQYSTSQGEMEQAPEVTVQSEEVTPSEEEVLINEPEMIDCATTVFDECSTSDYMQKFKEIASSMEKAVNDIT